MDFQPFPKIARLAREIVITEKIDGTNAQIHIVDESELHEPTSPLWMFSFVLAKANGRCLLAGSRSKYLTVGADGVKGEDNFGFARWALQHSNELWALGEGRHYGEWWGSGIQRGYGLIKGEKRFSLFNVARWHAVGSEPYVMQGADPRQQPKVSQEAPACCGVVPVMYRGPFSEDEIDASIHVLGTDGSLAAPGFLKPEGIVVFHTASGTLYKRTLEKDTEPKGVAVTV